MRAASAAGVGEYRVDERLNCWDFHACGRGPEGPGAMRADTCRAAREATLDGVNGGQNAGRACWAVVGTLAIDAPDCVVRGRCSRCEFRRRVLKEELPDLTDCHTIFERLGYADILALSCRQECDPDESAGDEV